VAGGTAARRPPRSPTAVPRPNTLAQSGNHRPRKRAREQKKQQAAKTETGPAASKKRPASANGRSQSFSAPIIRYAQRRACRAGQLTRATPSASAARQPAARRNPANPTMRSGCGKGLGNRNADARGMSARERVVAVAVNPCAARRARMREHRAGLTAWPATSSVCAAWMWRDAYGGRGMCVAAFRGTATQPAKRSSAWLRRGGRARCRRRGLAEISVARRQP